MNVQQLEATAIRTQQAAGRAWTDLMNAKPWEKEEMQANYDAAQDMAQDAYDVWKAAQ